MNNVATDVIDFRDGSSGTSLETIETISQISQRENLTPIEGRECHRKAAFVNDVVHRYNEKKSTQVDNSQASNQR
jgi:hypothetical protein